MLCFADYSDPVSSFLSYFSYAQGIEENTHSFCFLPSRVETVPLCISVLWVFTWNKSLTLSCAKSEGFLCILSSSNHFSNPLKSAPSPRVLSVQGHLQGFVSDSDIVLLVTASLAVTLLPSRSSSYLARVSHPGSSRLPNGCL